MEYVVIVHKAEEGGYWVEVPALEGCFAQGETLEAALEDARGAIAAHVAALRAEGRTAPTGEGIIVATVRAPEPDAA